MGVYLLLDNGCRSGIVGRLRCCCCRVRRQNAASPGGDALVVEERIALQEFDVEAVGESSVCTISGSVDGIPKSEVKPRTI